MLVLKKIAVTGGLACGKSQVCRIFKKLGAYIVSADEIVHQILSPETPIGKEVIGHFGKDIVTGNEINRENLAKKVFNNQEQLMALEKILHPAVREKIDQLFQTVKEGKKHSLFVAEIPLLYESEEPFSFDAVIAVTADEALCKQRSPKGWEKRAQRQLPQEEKAKRADYVIENNGSLEMLEDKVKNVYKQITGE